MKPRNSFISPRALHQKMRTETGMRLVDVRSKAEYADGHAAGALSEPLEGLEAKRLIRRLGDGAGTQETIHLICTSGRRAEQTAERLREHGLNNLLVVDGGTEAWAAQKLPIERQTRRLSLERQTQIALGVLLLLMLVKGLLLHPLFYALIGLLGVGLIVAGVTARCGLASVVARMPWNRLQSEHTASA